MRPETLCKMQNIKTVQYLPVRGRDGGIKSEPVLRIVLPLQRGQLALSPWLISIDGLQRLVARCVVHIHMLLSLAASLVEDIAHAVTEGISCRSVRRILEDNDRGDKNGVITVRVSGGGFINGLDTLVRVPLEHDGRMFEVRVGHGLLSEGIECGAQRLQVVALQVDGETDNLGAFGTLLTGPRAHVELCPLGNVRVRAGVCYGLHRSKIE